MITQEQINKLKTKYIAQEGQGQAQATEGGTGARLNVSAYLTAHGIEHGTKMNGSKTLFTLTHCLFNPDHGPNEASIGQGADGKLFYQCFHDGCRGRTWQEARKLISGEERLDRFVSTDVSTEVSRKQPPSSAGVRSVSVRELLAAEFKPRETILSPWLPTQGLTMVHAPRGVGKTLLGVGIAVAVSSGGKFLHWEAPRPFGCLYLDGEMPGAVLQERIAQAVRSSETEPTEVFRIITPDLQKAGMPDLSTDNGQKAIEPHLEGVELVIVDNISTLCRTGRENEAESWLPLQEWALRLRANGLSVLFVHHDGKGGQQRGTSRKEDVLDTVIHLKRPGDYRPEQGARFEVHFEKARMLFGDDVKPVEVQLHTDPGGGWEWSITTIEESLTVRVADLLNDGVPQREIHELLGVTKGAVSKCKTKAITRGLVKN